MSSNYDTYTASHYAAYRPALHKVILDKCLKNNTSFSSGLDVGCGTGNSTIALTFFCTHVMGVDPSACMIDKAEIHPNVSYQYCDGKSFNFNANTFDVSTFAGSLFYAKSQTLLDEIIRISTNNALLIVYDFDILLNEVLKQFKFTPSSHENYNHQADFSGLKENSISLLINKIEIIPLTVAPHNLAHLLLSIKSQQQFFENKFSTEGLHQNLTDNLKTISNNKDFKIDARIFYKVYTVLK